MEFLSLLLEVELSQKDLNYFDKLITLIRDKIEADVGFEKGYPTDIWLAGMFNTPGEKVDSAFRAYDRWLKEYTEENPGEKPDYSSEEVRNSMSAMAMEGRRIRIAYGILEKNGLLERSKNSLTGYWFNRSNRPMAEKMSRLRYYLSDETNMEKFKSDAKKVVTDANEKANLEWAESLNPKQSRYLEIFKGLDKNSFQLLTYISKMHRENGHAAANNEMSARLNDSDTAALTLRSLGVIKDNGNIDYQTVIGLLDFLSNPPGIAPTQVAQTLSTFNKEISFLINRKEANRALTQNVLDKRLGSNEMSASDEKILNIINSMSPSEIDAALSYGRGSPDEMDQQLLRKIRLIDSSGSPTEIGDVVIKVIRASNGNPELFTDRLQAMSRINRHERRYMRAINQTRTAKNLFGDLKKNIRFGKS